MWKLFPRLLEQKINALLDEAEPNRMRAYQIYKACQYENLWNDNFSKFSQNLACFFSLPKIERTKSHFDIYLDRPMHKSIFENFKLDFRSATLNESNVLSLSSWAHHMMRINFKSNSHVISLDVMKKTLNYITNPPPFEKAQDIDFEDFCNAWKQVVFNLFGRKYDNELQNLLNELNLLNKEQKQLERAEKFIPQIYLTQTEIDWTTSVQAAAENFTLVPKYPLTRGPLKTPLIELDRVTQLYNLIVNSEKSELAEHRINVRATLIYRCAELLRLRAR